MKLLPKLLAATSIFAATAALLGRPGRCAAWPARPTRRIWSSAYACAS